MAKLMASFRAPVIRGMRCERDGQRGGTSRARITRNTSRQDGTGSKSLPPRHHGQASIKFKGWQFRKDYISPPIIVRRFTPAEHPYPYPYP